MAKTKINYKDLTKVNDISRAELQLHNTWQPIFEVMEQNFNLVAGEIFSKADIRKLAKEERPRFVTNYFKPFIRHVVGNFMGSIPGLDFHEVTNDDARMAKIMEDLNWNIMFQANDTNYELAQAYIYMSICKFGWLNQYYSYEADAQGMVKIECADPFRIKFDPAGRKRDQSDWSYLSYYGMLSPEEIISLYALNNFELAGLIEEAAIDYLGEDELRKGKVTTWDKRISKANTLNETGKGYDNNYYGNTSDWFDGYRFKVVDWYERRNSFEVLLYDRTKGYMKDITQLVKRDSVDDSSIYNPYQFVDQNKLSLMVQQANSSPEDVVINPKSIIYQTSVCPAMNLVLFDAPCKVQNGRFKFTQIFADNFHPDITKSTCLVDDIKDMVKSYNLRDNTELTAIMRGTHGGIWAEASAVKGREDDIRKNEIGGMKVFNDGALSAGKVKEAPMPQVPNALELLKANAKEDMKAVSSIRDNSQGGSETANENAKLVQTRIAQSEIGMEWLSNQGQYAYLAIAKNNIAFIQEYMTEERQFQIIRDYDDPYWLAINMRAADRVLNDVTVGKFDIVISKKPYGIMARQRMFDETMKLANVITSLRGAQAVPINEIIDNSAVPNRAAWKQANEAVEGQMNAQMQAQAAMSQLQKDSLSIKNKNDEVNLQNNEDVNIVKQLAGGMV